jgi:anti-sigma factor RsiW
MNIEQKLILYHDNQLDIEERTEVEQALANDPSLQAQLLELQSLNLVFQTIVDQESQAYEYISVVDQVMVNLPDSPQILNRQTKVIPNTYQSYGEKSPSSLKSWFAIHWHAIMFGAGIAAAVLLTWQWIGPIMSSQANTNRNSTVLINLHESHEAESAPVIWLLDEEDTDNEAGNSEQDQADEPPPI